MISDSAFTKGFTTYSHIYQRIGEHESSKTHNDAVSALFHAQSGKDIETYVNKNMVDARKREVLANVKVLKRILAVIKFLGKQALPYRGHHNESAYSLEEQTADHGNFLELILLIAQFDAPLNLHVKKVMEASKRRHEKLKTEGKEKSRGRGGLSSMLSKTTVNKILDGIMQKKIVDEIGEQKFSVQMDGTQDTSVVDQETIIIRYVKEEQVKERLFAIRKVVDASGSGLHQLLKSVLESNGLKMSNIVGESFDGAANMRGAYNGLQKFITAEAPNSVYI